MREYFLEDIMHPKGGIWIKCKDDKDCKYYDTESRSFPCCTDIYGAVRYMEADGFCSKGERSE